MFKFKIGSHLVTVQKVKNPKRPKRTFWQVLQEFGKEAARVTQQH
ncbi:hypothetical protein [Tenacibaculum agarivorans]|nr:hypothetical protein [Tenacibaculum agarivorans]